MIRLEFQQSAVSILILRRYSNIRNLFHVTVPCMMIHINLLNLALIRNSVPVFPKNIKVYKKLESFCSTSTGGVNATPPHCSAIHPLGAERATSSKDSAHSDSSALLRCLSVDVVILSLRWNRKNPLFW